MDELSFRMHAAWRSFSLVTCDRLNQATNRLMHQDATQRMIMLRERLLSMDERMTRAQKMKITAGTARHETLQARLHSLSPLAVLGRGYALIFSEDGTLIKKHDQVIEGELLTTRLASGKLQSRVIRKDPE